MATMMVFSGSANPELAHKVVNELHIPLGDATVGRAWRELCRLNRTRLCDVGVSKLREANAWKDGVGKAVSKH